MQPGSFTFGSKSGKMPVTLVNDLTQTVNVVLRLEPQTPRLRLGDVTVPPIGPQQKIQVNVPVTKRPSDKVDPPDPPAEVRLDW